MKSPSLDLIHNSLHRQILLAQSYTEVPELAFIIKACRLKPYDYVLKEKTSKLVLYKWWFDEFGNSLHIKGKKLQITYNDLELDQEQIVCTDLYYGLSLDKVARISKLVYLQAGKDSERRQDCCLLTLLGLDNYLRSYLYLHDEWTQVSPLLLGLPTLRLLGRNLDTKYFRQLGNKDNMPVPCISSQEWISFVPLSPIFRKLVRNQCEYLEGIFHEAPSQTTL